MTIEKRRAIENRIAKRLIMDALAAGYAVAVYDGQDYFGPYKHSAEVRDRMFSVDDEQLIIYDKAGQETGTRLGWVRLIYGNDGYDVVADYTTNLEDLLKGANELADEICNSL